MEMFLLIFWFELPAYAQTCDAEETGSLIIAACYDSSIKLCWQQKIERKGEEGKCHKIIMHETSRPMDDVVYNKHFEVVQF